MSKEIMSGLRPNRRHFIAGAAAAAAVSTFTVGGRAQAPGAGKVMFYSTMPTRYATPMIEAFHASDTAKQNGVELEMYFANGYTLYERATAEYTAGRVAHDMLMLTDPSLFVELSSQSRLLDYVSPELEAYPEAQRDPNGLWCNGRTVLSIYGYNTRSVPNGAEMKGWADFLAPEFADGRIGIPNAMEGGGALQNYINIRNHPDLGIKFWEELAALNPTIASGPSPLTKMNISGETPLAINNDYNLYEERRNGAPVAPIYPEEVITASIIPMAIAKQAPNPEGAKMVYDWWLSQEGQSVLRDVNSVYSGRADVEPLSGAPSISDLNVVVTPIEELEARRTEMQNEFKTIFNV